MSRWARGLWNENLILKTYCVCIECVVFFSLSAFSSPSLWFLRFSVLKGWHYCSSFDQDLGLESSLYWWETEMYSVYCIHWIYMFVHRFSMSSSVCCIHLPYPSIFKSCFLCSACTCPFFKDLFLIQTLSKLLFLLLWWGCHLDGLLSRL